MILRLDKNRPIPKLNQQQNPSIRVYQFFLFFFYKVFLNYDDFLLHFNYIINNCVIQTKSMSQ